MIDWMQEHEVLLWWLGALSVVTFLSTLIVVPWLVVRIPADYFTHTRRERMALVVQNPLLRIFLKIGKNLLGVIFVLAGLIMLVLPGQGLLTILLGMMVMDFPGKERLLHWIVTRPSVFHSMNWMRQKAGKEPLVLEEYKTISNIQIERD